MALEPTQAFTWGAGGARMTPEAIAAQRKVAQALMAQGMDYSPIQSPWQGAARVAQAMLGGFESGQADAAAKANSDAEAKLLSALFAGGAASPTAAIPATSAAPMGSTSIPVSSGAVIPNDANAFPGQAGMDARLADASQDFIQDNPGTYLSSGVRSTADQARLYADRANNPNPVARPGTSRHERGLAIDIGGMNADQRAMLPQYGLAQPVANDPPHVELAPNVQVASNDPAALPVNAQAAQGFAIPGQGAASGVNPALVRAMSSPYISDGTKKILGLVLSQQMDTAQKAADPMRQLQIRKLEADLATGKNPESVREYEYAKKNGYEGTFQDWIASKRAGAGEYSLTPVYGKDAQGNTVLIQPGKSGTAVQTKLPEGVTISSGVEKVDLGTQWGIMDKRSGQIIGYQPKDLKGAESQKALGKAQGGMQATLPSDIHNAETTITQIDDLIKHPGLSAIVGPLDQFRPNWTMGAEGRDALARFNQLKGKAFLQAYSTLRGGGQITEVEGAKAENAMARMDRAQSEAEFATALKDFRDAVQVGMQKLREKAGVAPSTVTKPQSGPVTINGYNIEAVD